MGSISSEELGRRRFQVLRDKAAEQALEKIRKSFLERGSGLTVQETVVIRDVLREIWSGIDPVAWQSFSFSRLTEDDISTTLAAGKGTKDQKAAVTAMAETLKKILDQKNQ